MTSVAGLLEALTPDPVRPIKSQRAELRARALRLGPDLHYLLPEGVTFDVLCSVCRARVGAAWAVESPMLGPVLPWHEGLAVPDLDRWPRVMRHDGRFIPGASGLDMPGIDAVWCDGAVSWACPRCPETPGRVARVVDVLAVMATEEALRWKLPSGNRPQRVGPIDAHPAQVR